MVDRLAPTVVRTAAVIRKSGLWDMVLICGGLGIYVWALFLLVLLRTFAVILDRHGGPSGIWLLSRAFGVPKPSRARRPPPLVSCV